MPPEAASQRGQAILWFLSTVAACCAVFALVYNVGQVTNEKEKTVNAADAAALSASLVEARMLNFEAYANRGMIANEVTIAQAVSLDSWLRYDQELTFYIATYTKVVPYLNAATQFLNNVLKVAVNVYEPVAAAMIYAAEAANVALLAARENANYLGPVAANQVAGEIAKANSTTFNNRSDTQPQLNGAVQAAAFALNEAAWLGFTNSNTGNKRADAKQVILNSRDQFSTYRGAGKLIDLLDKVLILPKYVLLPYVQLKKTSGGTTLKDYDHWEAQDSTDLSASHFSCHWFSCGWKTDWVPVPIGYGRSDADGNGSQGDDLCTVNPSTFNCRMSFQNGHVFSMSQAIPNIRDLAKRMGKDNDCAKTNGSDGPGLDYLVAVQKAPSDTMTTQRIGNPGMNTVDVAGPQGSPRLADNFKSDQLMALAQGCTFFLRPDRNARDLTQADLARSDGVHEYASLYNPYWQSRLAPVSKGNKILAYTLAYGDPLLGATAVLTTP
jgi:hypothetical protein